MTCLSCKNEVTVNPIRYGDGFIATCPKCGKLAMNERRKVEDSNNKIERLNFAWYGSDIW
jgi:predicted RNA-binding Zn-ribbon protein involved in translation (DUF1610 family)